jgi:hypothetical protein
LWICITAATNSSKSSLSRASTVNTITHSLYSIRISEKPLPWSCLPMAPRYEPSKRKAPMIVSLYLANFPYDWICLLAAAKSKVTNVYFWFTALKTLEMSRIF